ncbi:MarR family winged helix-turn-helix transcriptional regulator [Roseibium sp.]|uniref:MarR family winged helix-turn-helix transcriptional regulator n=1 Tax=Roseibium sp. TaxID=1936156 RepID=UPI003BA86B76
MENDSRSRVRPLLDRLQRLIASEDWADDLNPAQRSALGYLVRANRFSRSPSQVADYLCTTRGTASQTLKALEKKGLIERSASDADKRTISYDVTQAGFDVAGRMDALDEALGRLDTESGAALEKTLSELIRLQLAARGFRSFGLCRTCKYHRTAEAGLYCTLLQVDLTAEQADELCHEHAAA